MWERVDSQEVGLEAAILERVRNSSLVERACAENPTGLKYTTEAVDFREVSGGFVPPGPGVVGERCSGRGSGTDEEPWRDCK